MRQSIAAQDPGGNWKQSGLGSDTLNLLFSSEAKQRETSRCPGPDISNMRQLLDEFNGLYEQRLRRLELDPGMTREEQLQVSKTSST